MQLLTDDNNGKSEVTMLTIFGGDNQKKPVLKKQDEERRHGIEDLNRVTAYVGLTCDVGFQPPWNFIPESRAAPLGIAGFQRKFAQAFVKPVQSAKREISNAKAQVRLQCFKFSTIKINLILLK